MFVMGSSQDTYKAADARKPGPLNADMLEYIRSKAAATLRIMPERKETTYIGAKIWEGDKRRKAHFSESGGSLYGPNLCIDSPFL